MFDVFHRDVLTIAEQVIHIIYIGIYYFSTQLYVFLGDMCKPVISDIFPVKIGRIPKYILTIPLLMIKFWYICRAFSVQPGHLYVWSIFKIRNNCRERVIFNTFTTPHTTSILHISLSLIFSLNSPGAWFLLKTETNSV